ncbi:hypothetical protein ACFCXA_14655 [Streptomyces virginiae]|uniref:hypothetical protein n=1 Tax=Streptomyces virginiae TaxID=1961 RepID=UPI0035D8A9C6
MGLLGLLNPVTGVLLGTVVAGEVLPGRQLCGLAPASSGVVLGRPSAKARQVALSDRAASGPADHPRRTAGPFPRP